MQSDNFNAERSHSLFFRSHGKWPNSESISEELKDFPEFNDSVINYPQRLLLERNVLKKELLSIGSDLSIAELLFGRIKDRGRMWQGSFDAPGETFSQSDLLRVKPNIS